MNKPGRIRLSYRWGAIFILLFVVGTFTACDKKGTAPTRPRGGRSPLEIGPDRVVARIGEREINRSQLARMVNYYTQALLRQGQEPPPGFEESVLDRLIESELLYQIGLRMDIPDLERRLDEKFNKVVDGYPSERAFAEDLARNNLTVDLFRESLKKEVIVNCVLDRKVYDVITVSEEEIEKYYEKNRERLEKPERIRVSQIFVAVPRVATAEEKAAARKKAAELKERCEAGEDFGELARQHSDDKQSAARSGDLGLKRKGEWLPALEEVSWGLMPGRVSSPVETRFGYHLIRVDEKLPAGLPPIDEVRDEITAALRAQKSPKKLGRLVEEARKEIKVEKLWSKD